MEDVVLFVNMFSLIGSCGVVFYIDRQFGKFCYFIGEFDVFLLGDIIFWGIDGFVLVLDFIGVCDVDIVDMGVCFWYYIILDYCQIGFQKFKDCFRYWIVVGGLYMLVCMFKEIGQNQICILLFDFEFDCVGVIVIQCYRD